MLEYTPQLLISAITEGSIYALMGLGLSIIYRSTDVMFFAQGTLAMIAGVSLYGLTQFHLPLYAAVPICLIICVIVALAAQYAVIMPLLDRGVPPLSVSMITSVNSRNAGVTSMWRPVMSIFILLPLRDRTMTTGRPAFGYWTTGSSAPRGTSRPCGERSAGPHPRGSSRSKRRSKDGAGPRRR